MVYRVFLLLFACLLIVWVCLWKICIICLPSGKRKLESWNYGVLKPNITSTYVILWWSVTYEPSCSQVWGRKQGGPNWDTCGANEAFGHNLAKRAWIEPMRERAGQCYLDSSLRYHSPFVLFRNPFTCRHFIVGWLFPDSCCCSENQ